MKIGKFSSGVCSDFRPADGADGPWIAEQSARRKVLVVDDEPLLRWAVAEVLRDRGYSVVPVNDAEGAVAAIVETAPFDVVLLDVRQPARDDLALFTRIRSLSPASRVIAMIAPGVPEAISLVLDRGAFGIIYKPFDLAELALLVARAAARPV